MAPAILIGNGLFISLWRAISSADFEAANYLYPNKLIFGNIFDIISLKGCRMSKRHSYISGSVEGRDIDA
jgi:hypothetical protein